MKKVIETERLILRPITIEDAPAVLRYGTNAEVSRYTGDAGDVQTIDDARRVIKDVILEDYRKYGYGRFALVEKESSEMIGFCGMKFLPEHGVADLGYRMLPEYWGKGYATEAGRASLTFAKEELKLVECIGMAHVENVASQKVLEKLGFTLYKEGQESGLPCRFYRISWS